MINKETLGQIIQNIYRDLSSDARKGTNGIFWETISLVPNEHQVLKDVNETLVNGVSGIVVFLIEYFKETKDTTALEKIKQACDWLVQYCNDKEMNSIGFYYGRSGVAYTLIQLSLLTEDKAFLEKAEGILSSCNVFASTNRKTIPANFANGLSGLLFVQLTLFQLTEKQSILDEINGNLEILLSHLRINDCGIHFDQPFYSKRPLISLPDGNAGIGHVLIQLGTYFNNETLKSISKQLFDYENACYSPAMGNWPDFANTEFFNKNRANYANNSQRRNKKFFDVESDTVSWHMGAPSVGFSRITAVFTGHDEYLEDVNKAVDKTKSYLRQSLSKQKENKFTLLSGLAGAGLFLLEAQKIETDPTTLALVEETATQAIKQYERLSYFKSDHYFAAEVADNTLFTGECGIGYFFIQLLKQDNDPTILSPRVNLKEKSNYKLGEFDLNKVYNALLQTYYSKSFAFLKEINKEADLRFENIRFAEFHNTYSQYLAGLSENADKLKSIFAYEIQKIQLLKNDNFLFTYVKNKSLQEELTKFLETTDDKKLLRSRLCVNETCKLGHYQNGEKKYMALKQIFNGVHEMPLNQFSYTIFNSFNTPKTVESAIEEIIKATGAKTQQEIEEIRQLTLKQVRQGLKVSLLNIKKVKFLGINIK